MRGGQFVESRESLTAAGCLMPCNSTDCEAFQCCEEGKEGTDVSTSTRPSMSAKVGVEEEEPILRE